MKFGRSFWFTTPIHTESVLNTELCHQNATCIVKTTHIRWQSLIKLSFQLFLLTLLLHLIRLVLTMTQHVENCQKIKIYCLFTFLCLLFSILFFSSTYLCYKLTLCSVVCTKITMQNNICFLFETSFGFVIVYTVIISKWLWEFLYRLQLSLCRIVCLLLCHHTFGPLLSLSPFFPLFFLSHFLNSLFFAYLFAFHFVFSIFHFSVFPSQCGTKKRICVLRFDAYLNKSLDVYFIQ